MSLYTQTPKYYLEQVEAALSNGVPVEGKVIILKDLPTADPEVVGQLWNNAGVLTVSAG